MSFNEDNANLGDTDMKLEQMIEQLDQAAFECTNLCDYMRVEGIETFIVDVRRIRDQMIEVAEAMRTNERNVRILNKE